MRYNNKKKRLVQTVSRGLLLLASSENYNYGRVNRVFQGVRLAILIIRVSGFAVTFYLSLQYQIATNKQKVCLLNLFLI